MAPDLVRSQSYGAVSIQSTPSVEPDPIAPRLHSEVAPPMNDTETCGDSDALMRRKAPPALPNGGVSACRVETPLDPCGRGGPASACLGDFFAKVGMAGLLSRFISPRIGRGHMPLNGRNGQSCQHDSGAGRGQNPNARQMGPHSDHTMLILGDGLGGSGLVFDWCQNCPNLADLGEIHANGLVVEGLQKFFANDCHLH